ncbi:MAG TPA: hypothetical protein PKM25_10570, partial [Candidatus Ozemobacteraceae bacterium]|nr:hypothetical protein [Candidatus Ozemobacteraceae bacterium]
FSTTESHLFTKKFPFALSARPRQMSFTFGSGIIEPVFDTEHFAVSRYPRGSSSLLQRIVE